ncbi:hypothetical protein AZE42_07358 [Rhizopogon vesiculosus]|uniref:Uncharacterized protein n=1 Tax=Rhizopogon vesiculosus TaxID=180088 RepID=A0A1J8QYS4_9AGAM|nr:hypothetical protein AZE42_07358 [Rhizopogon vesiculosus]
MSKAPARRSAFYRIPRGKEPWVCVLLGDQVVYRIGERVGSFNWVIRKTDDGYTLSQSTVEDPDKHYFWFLSESGMPIVTADSGEQSWVFDGPYPDV